MSTYHADAAKYRSLQLIARALNLEVTTCRDPQKRQTVIIIWEKGEELISKGFDEVTGDHNGNVWLERQLHAYYTWR